MTEIHGPVGVGVGVDIGAGSCYGGLAPEQRLALLEKMGALASQRDQYEWLRGALACLAAVNPGRSAVLSQLDVDAQKLRAVDTKAITAAMPPGPAVGAALRQARLEVLA